MESVITGVPDFLLNERNVGGVSIEADKDGVTINAVGKPLYVDANEEVDGQPSTAKPIENGISNDESDKPQPIVAEPLNATAEPLNGTVETGPIPITREKKEDDVDGARLSMKPEDVFPIPIAQPCYAANESDRISALPEKIDDGNDKIQKYSKKKLYNPRIIKRTIIKKPIFKSTANIKYKKDIRILSGPVNAKDGWCGVKDPTCLNNISTIKNSSGHVTHVIIPGCGSSPHIHNSELELQGDVCEESNLVCSGSGSSCTAISTIEKSAGHVTHLIIQGCAEKCTVTDNTTKVCYGPVQEEPKPECEEVEMVCKDILMSNGKKTHMHEVVTKKCPSDGSKSNEKPNKKKPACDVTDSICYGDTSGNNNNNNNNQGQCFDYGIEVDKYGRTIKKKHCHCHVCQSKSQCGTDSCNGNSTTKRSDRNVHWVKTECGLNSSNTCNKKYSHGKCHCHVHQDYHSGCEKTNVTCPKRPGNVHCVPEPGCCGKETRIKEDIIIYEDNSCLPRPRCGVKNPKFDDNKVYYDYIKGEKICSTCPPPRDVTDCVGPNTKISNNDGICTTSSRTINHSGHGHCNPAPECVVINTFNGKLNECCDNHSHECCNNHIHEQSHCDVVEVDTTCHNTSINCSGHGHCNPAPECGVVGCNCHSNMIINDCNGNVHTHNKIQCEVTDNTCNTTTTIGNSGIHVHPVITPGHSHDAVIDHCNPHIHDGHVHEDRRFVVTGTTCDTSMNGHIGGHGHYVKPGCGTGGTIYGKTNMESYNRDVHSFSDTHVHNTQYNQTNDFYQRNTYGNSCNVGNQSQTTRRSQVKMDIEVTSNSSALDIGDNEVLITASFTNPLSTYLHNGVFYIEGSSMEDAYCFRIPRIRPGERVFCKALMHPKDIGYEFIVAKFHCAEIKKIVGFTNMRVDYEATISSSCHNMPMYRRC